MHVSKQHKCSSDEKPPEGAAMTVLGNERAAGKSREGLGMAEKRSKFFAPVFRTDQLREAAWGESLTEVARNQKQHSLMSVLNSITTDKVMGRVG